MHLKWILGMLPVCGVFFKKQSRVLIILRKNTHENIVEKGEQFCWFVLFISLTIPRFSNPDG